MKKFLCLAVLLFGFNSFAAGPPGSATGPVQSVETADVVSVKTLNAVCATPATGCPAGSFVSVKLGGRSNVGIQLNSTALNASPQAYISYDGGVNWQGAPMRVSSAASGGALTPGAQPLNETAFRVITINPVYGVATDAMLALTAYTSGSTVATMVATNGNAIAGLLSTVLSLKGVQANSAVQTQDIKDSGRTYVTIVADGVTPAIAETVVTFTKTVADTQTTAQTSYTITNLKTFRIQAICASFTAGATANRVRLALRLNTGGACVAGSNILLPAIELAPNYGTATAAEGGANGCVPIPDGLEIAGNGTKAICLSESATAAAGTLTANLIGYEY